LNNSKYKSKVAAVIPFYNEKDFIYDVVLQTLYFVDRVFAVDDGSNDGSKKLIENINGVEIISLNSNHGKGYALQMGFNECLKYGYDFIVTLDGDNQHKPDLIPIFLEQIKHFNLVIGNRLSDTAKMPLQRIFSNRITSFFLSIKTGQKIIDSQCGYRIYKREVLQKIKTFSSGYEAESEMIIYSARAGFKIGFVNIPTIYGNEKSKMNPLQAIIGFIRILNK
jgi:glycosyltransferase involved in cell wall biosynthesis